MKTKRLLIALCACVALLLALAGCSSAASSGSGSTRTVTDAYGRNVTIPADVQTCATVGSAARFVAYAGGTDKLVAVTEMDKPATLAAPIPWPGNKSLRSFPRLPTVIISWKQA